MKKKLIFSAGLSLLVLGLVACKKYKPLEKKEASDIYGKSDIVISVFWPPMKGFATDQQYKYLVEAGIDLLEWGGGDPIFTDLETIEETLRLCKEYGIKITITDKDFDGLLTKTEGQIRELVRKYKDHEAVVGFTLSDEPANANPYGRVARAIGAEYPGAISLLNMLPAWALEDAKGHAQDWINAAGPENLRYLSYDQYPFDLTQGSVPQMFSNMNLVREIGLKYGVDTALYLQSIGVIGAFRRPTVDETRYHASAALAYGYKNLKYFTWMTPVERSEEFTLAIIAPDGSKTDTFKGIKEINHDIKKVSFVLGNLDALEIKHNGRQDDATEMLENGWHVEALDKKDYLVSFMVDRDTGQNYLMVVNKDFKKKATISLKLNGINSLTDITEGYEKKVKIKNSTIKLKIKAGAFALLALDEDLRLQKEYPDKSSENYALDKPVYTSFSIGADGYYGSNLVDGNFHRAEMKKGYRYEGTKGQEAYIIIDMINQRTISEVAVYPISENPSFAPLEYTIYHSKDGTNYTKLPGNIFDPIETRYVKISLDEMVNVGGKLIAELQEIEIRGPK